MSAVAMRWCEFCSDEVAESAGPCPYSFTCPTCAAPPRSKCKRPSEHEAMEMHRARLDLEFPEQPQNRPLPASAQLEGPDGRYDERNAQARLFEPAPNQLAGQTHLDTDTSNEGNRQCQTS